MTISVAPRALLRRKPWAAGWHGHGKQSALDMSWVEGCADPPTELWAYHHEISRLCIFWLGNTQPLRRFMRLWVPFCPFSSSLLVLLLETFNFRLILTSVSLFPTPLTHLFKNITTSYWHKQPIFCPVHAFFLLSTVSLGPSESTFDVDERYLW